MEFYYNTNQDSLYDDIDFLCGSTSATYPILDKRRNIYNAYNDVSRLIWSVAYGWQYDDSNRTDLPIAVTNLVDGQADYGLPTNAQRIERVEVMNSQGDYQKLKNIDTRDIGISIDEFEGTNGMPQYYDMIGRSIMLYPTPASGDVTLASGLQIIVSRDVSAFASASTAEPGFARPFHKILSLGAAIDFTRDPSELKRFVEMRNRLEQGLIRFYSKREEEGKTRIEPRNKGNWYQYV